jgi:hypothetical protein
MAEQQRDKIEYDFEDLRRNEDPIPDNVLDQLGLEEQDLTEDERHDDKQAKDDSEELDDREEEDDELDEDGEYKPAKMTNAMRKRIMKVKRDAKREIAEAKEEAGEEISKLNKRIDELEKSGKTDELDNEFSGKLEDLESQMEAAMEEGDSKKVTSLTRKMSELTADMRDRKRELESDEPDDLEDEGKEEPKIIPRAVEWLKEQDWWDDEELGHVRKFVRKADMALQRKGYKPTDDDFYEQLEAIIEKKYPGVVEHTMSEYEDEDEDEDLDLDEEFEEEDEDEFVDVPSKKKSRRAKKKRRARSPVSEGDRGGVSRTKKKFRKKRGKTLSAARVKNMQLFGMDPENPDHVEAYLDNNP